MTGQNIWRRKPYPLGAYAEDEFVRFSFVSDREDSGILIYDRKTGKLKEKLDFSPDERVGNVWCKYVAGLAAADFSYQFCAGGEPVADRYGRMFVHMPGYGRENSERERRAVLPKEDFDWEGDAFPRTPYRESICYCAHVRGFTKHSSSGVEHRGTFLGMTEKLGHLKNIGITAVELQPAYEFAEITVREEGMPILPKCNYWGYKEGFYYAPKAAYAAGEDAVSEFKQMVRAFHRKGIELILQFYFPDTVRKGEIADILRFWRLEYHVDGFHLMGSQLPADLIAQDPVLADVKLWYDHFDADAVYGQSGAPAQKNLAVFRDDYLYAMRKFLKGDENMLESVMEQMRHIPQKTGRIHYMSHYNGFTLMDMVSYARKHNEANGEDNRDGSDYNCSWNCGEEGVSRRKKTIALRKRQIRNAMTMLLFSQSTPLIFMGDEFGNSQKGNNNPYCLDSPVTWLNWKDMERNSDILDFWIRTVRLRREHPILHPESELRIMDSISCGYPDLSYHGESAWRPRTEGYNRHIGVMYCGKYARTREGREDDFFYAAMNMYWEKRELALPKLPKGLKWKLLYSTFEEDAGEISQEGIVVVFERSISIYTSVPDETAIGKGGKKSRPRMTIEDYSDRTAF